MKRRVAFISEHASPLAVCGGVDSGGQNVYVAELCMQLAEKDYQIDIFTRRETFALPVVVEWLPNINVIHINAGPVECLAKELLLGYMDQFADGMVDYIEKEQIDYDIVHANFFMSALVASNVKKRLGIPYVVTFHALGLVRKIHQKEMDAFPEERISIEKFIVQDADHIIAECPQDMEDLFAYYGAEPQRVTIVPCGFNPAEFFPVDKKEARDFLKLDHKDKILLQLGRVVPRKGIDNVIEAVAKLKKMSNVKLLIVGGEDEVPDFEKSKELRRLKQIALDEGVENQVIFTGRKDRNLLKYYYSAVDIFISTPWYEPFGITPLESMACGTPVIGSNVGGIKFSVHHNQTGYLVPPNNPEKLAERIEQMFEDEVVYDQMCQRSLDRVNQMFTWKKVAERMEAVYKHIWYGKYEKIITSEPTPLVRIKTFTDQENKFIDPLYLVKIS